MKYFCDKLKKYFNHSHFKTNTALRIKFHAHYIFTKILIFIYNNAYKKYPFCIESMKTCVHTSVSNKNQSSFQTKGFGLVQKILEICERTANIFLHPAANYTYMYNLHTVCKSANMNGALDANWQSLIIQYILFCCFRNGIKRGRTCKLERFCSLCKTCCSFIRLLYLFVA